MSEADMDYPVGAAHFGERLGIARRALGNLVGDVAKRAIGEHVGVSGQQVGMWEAGTNLTDIETIERLADFLRVLPGWLAFGQPPMREVSSTDLLPRGVRELVEPPDKSDERAG